MSLTNSYDKQRSTNHKQFAGCFALLGACLRSLFSLQWHGLPARDSVAKTRAGSPCHRRHGRDLKHALSMTELSLPRCSHSSAGFWASAGGASGAGRGFFPGFFAAATGGAPSSAASTLLGALRLTHFFFGLGKTKVSPFISCAVPPPWVIRSWAD